MFTGLIQALGTVKSLQQKADSTTFEIEAPGFFAKSEIGASVAVNGTCLTAEKFTETSVFLTAIQQTLTITSLGQLQEGSLVNLELSCTPQTFLGGHYVMGHVDGVATVSEFIEREDGKEIILNVPANLMKYIIDKGSITLDGISLTVADKLDSQIKIAIIPETLKKTNIQNWIINTKVNIEVDVVGKYVESLMTAKNG